MAASWTLTAETAFSSGNTKTVDNFVAGYNNTITITGPGDGNYSALVSLYDPNGNLIDSYPISSSANVVGPITLQEGRSMYVPSLSNLVGSIAGGVIVSIDGGASKRFPSTLVTPASDGRSLRSSVPVVLPAASYATTLPLNSLSVGLDGDLIFIDGFGQPVYRGSKLWNWTVKNTTNKSLFITQTSETTIVDDFTPVNNIGRNGLRPVIKALRTIKMGSFRVRLRGGVQLGGSATNTLNIGIYAKESGAVKTALSSYAIPFTSMGANTANALDIEVESWIEHCGDATETTACNMRGHQDVRIGLNNVISAGSFEGLAETYASTLNLAIDQTIKVTAWWSKSGATLYVDGIDIWDA